MAAPVESFFLSPDAQGTLQAQIQQMVAEAILSGRLRRGDKLPSTRKLARHLGVSRITVTLAYTELQANDYLSSRGRSGYYVSDNAPDPPAFPPPAQAPTDRIDWGRAIGTRFTGGETPSKPRDWQSYRYPFTYGQPDLTLFDHNNWRLCALKALGQKDLADMSGDRYDSDDPDLVAFIASQILPRRGILAGPGNIMVTMGAQNALWLTAQVLLTQRRQAVIEDPCYYTLRDVLAQSRCPRRAGSGGRTRHATRSGAGAGRRPVHHAQPPMPDLVNHAAGPAAGFAGTRARDRRPDRRRRL